MGRAFLAVIVAAFLFGLATPASKSLLADAEPFALAGILYLGAAAATVVPTLRGRRALHLDRRNLGLLAGAVVAGGMLGPVLLLWGLRVAAATDVSLWLNLELVATAALGHWIFRDHLGPSAWAAVAAVTAGAVLLSWGGGATGWLAVAAVALACVMWGLDNHFTALLDGVPPAQATFWKGVGGGTVNLLLGAAVGSWPHGAVPWLGGLAVGALGYGASIVLYIHAAHGLGATRAQLVFATAPLWGVAGAVLALGESLAWRHLAASGLMALGVWLLLGEQHGHEHRHRTVTHSHSHRHDDHHEHPHAGPGAPSASQGHAHVHIHEGTRHSHPHRPDLHHRHGHRPGGRKR